MNERREALEEICRDFSVEILYAFGSRAREVAEWLAGARSDLASGPSDVDVTVKTSRGARLDIRDKVRLAMALDELFGVERVDLTVLAEADPFLALQVIRAERLWARDRVEADEYDLFVLKRAAELEPWERERQAMILRGKQ